MLCLSLQKKATVEVSFVEEISLAKMRKIDRRKFSKTVEKGENMDKKLFDSERKVMEVLWREGDLPAGNIAAILKDEIGWNRNTTYTVIKKCVEKGVIVRSEPKFLCHALLTREQAQQYETAELVDRMFDGSNFQFLSAFLSGGKLSRDEIRELREMIDQMK